MKSSFFNSVNYDRIYSAENWADYFNKFIGNGVYAKPDTGMQIVSDGGMGIKCLNGSCFINGYLGTSTDAEDKLTLEIGDSTYSRIDAIVARLDFNSRDIHIDVIQGFPAETPEKPEHIRSEMVYDLVLAYITIDVGATSISDANIEDARPNEAVCGFVKGTVDEIQTGELFKQYNAEWQMIMAGIKLDEPAIIEAFEKLNSVRSVNGVFPVNGNVEIPSFDIITGTYTGTGLYWTAKTNDLNGENNHGTQEDIFIDLGVTPLAVIVTKNTSEAIYKQWDISGTKAKGYYDTLFFIEGNNVFLYLTTNTYYPYGIVDGGFLANAGLNNAGEEYLYFAFIAKTSD